MCEPGGHISDGPSHSPVFEFIVCPLGQVLVGVSGSQYGVPSSTRIPMCEPGGHISAGSDGPSHLPVLGFIVCPLGQVLGGGVGGGPGGPGGPGGGVVGSSRSHSNVAVFKCWPGGHVLGGVVGVVGPVGVVSRLSKLFSQFVRADVSRPPAGGLSNAV